MSFKPVVTSATLVGLAFILACSSAVVPTSTPTPQPERTSSAPAPTIGPTVTLTPAPEEAIATSVDPSLRVTSKNLACQVI